MTVEEMNEIMLAVSTMDMSKVDISEQVQILAAFEAFANTVKPIVVKYKATQPNGGTFLFKL